jgi:hypothetical protein
MKHGKGGTLYDIRGLACGASGAVSPEDQHGIEIPLSAFYDGQIDFNPHHGMLPRALVDAMFTLCATVQSSPDIMFFFPSGAGFPRI